MGHIVHFLIQHGYLLIFLWLLAEQGAVPLPSVPLLLAAGAVARTGRLELHVILACGLLACLIADNIWFELGRRRGARVLRFICRISLEPDSCVRQTENLFVRYGMASLLVAKFVPGLNAVASPLAGSSGAGRAKFLLFDGLGSLIWMSSYVSAGYMFSNQLETAGAYAGRMGRGLIVAILGAAAAWLIWKFLQRRQFMRRLSVARITAGELREMLDSGEDILIVDVRSKLTGIANPIPGAIHIPAEDLSARHGEIPRDRDIVLFCT